MTLTLAHWVALGVQTGGATEQPPQVQLAVQLCVP
jgi:hypothetical protein